MLVCGDALGDMREEFSGELLGDPLSEAEAVEPRSLKSEAEEREALEIVLRISRLTSSSRVICILILGLLAIVIFDAVLYFYVIDVISLL